MSSPGTGSDISRPEANDLLEKLITDKIRVQAVFRGRGGVTATVQGTVSRPQPNTILVSERRTPVDPTLVFGLGDVKTFKYADTRAFPGGSGSSPIPGTPNLSSVLCFVYPDGAQVALFEIS